MNALDEKPDLLKAGIFTVQEAADLVGIRARLARAWVAGQKGKQEPVIDSQLGLVSGKVAISFTNLMELRFIAAFHKEGVRLEDIRFILNEAKEFLNHPHPAATKLFFQTDGRKIFGMVDRTSGDKVLYDLAARNYAMFPIIQHSLKKDVEFDPKGNAVLWYPRRDIAPHVIVDPRLSFGRPVLKKSRIPAETLAEAVEAEGSAQSVADLYEVPLAQVREAIRFHNDLQRAA